MENQKISNKPLISVVIPTYNRGELLFRAVESVLKQTYANIECIVIDDCSTDASIAYLQQMGGNDPRLIIKSHTQNLHASAARNTGISLAKGEFLAFLDDDDLWYPEKLAKQMALFGQSSSDTALIYCWLEIFKDNTKIDILAPTLKGDVFDECLAKQPLGNASTILIKAEVIEKIGAFDTSLPRGNDGDFIRRITQYYKVNVVEEVLVRYFVEHQGNQRISLNTVAGIRKSVFSQEVKLRKFAKELEIRPKQHQQILLSIARGYLSVGDIAPSVKALAKAFKIDPTVTSVYTLPYYSAKDALARMLVGVKR